MSDNKTFLYMLPLVVFVWLAILLYSSLDKDPRLLPSARLGQVLPAFSLPSLYGEQTISNQSMMGEASLVNVWATWCPSCRVEHPVLNQLAEEGVVIYGLNYKDDPVEARKYLEQLGNPYKKVIQDLSGDLGLDLGVYGAPETYVVGADGTIIYRHVGVVSLENWRSILLPLYQKAQIHSPSKEAIP